MDELLKMDYLSIGSATSCIPPNALGKPAKTVHGTYGILKKRVDFLMDFLDLQRNPTRGNGKDFKAADR
jgi:hypothetical protein